MEKKIKKLLVLFVFVIITVLLFAPCQNDPKCTESFTNNSYHHEYSNPRLRPSSKNINYRPETNKNTENDSSTFQVQDHIDLQKNGLDDPRIDVNLTENKMKKKVRFTDDNSVVESRHIVNDDVLPETNINRERIIDSNNIHGYCVHDEVPMDESNNAYSDVIHEDLDMDMDDSTYHRMVAFRPRMKTFIEIDPSVGKFMLKKGKGKQDIKGLDELQSVVNTYKKCTLDSIQGDYKGNENLKGTMYQ